jgi:hypothetical protein
MDKRRVPGLAGFAGLTAVGDSNDFKDEGMKGFIVPHPVEKCHAKLLPNWERTSRP